MARKIKAYIRIGLAMAKMEELFDLPEDWDEMSQKEQDGYLDELANEYAQNNSEYGAYVVEDKE